MRIYSDGTLPAAFAQDNVSEQTAGYFFAHLHAKNRNNRKLTVGYFMMDLANHKRIKVTVNGHEMEVYDNLTILQALLQENIHIPHLCYDIRLDRSNGNCGLCVVEVGENGERDVKESWGLAERYLILRCNRN